jgi:hypothetical protein
MTLVSTSVSARGITVVGDRAITVTDEAGNQSFVAAPKIFYSKAANISLTIWGNFYLPGKSMEYWMPDFVSEISETDTLEAVGKRLADELTSRLTVPNMSWGDYRRGIHLAGYVNSIPHIYHVHTGEPTQGHHPPHLYYDIPYGPLTLSFPPIDGGREPFEREKAYLAHLAMGGTAHLFNGEHVLFGFLHDALERLRGRLERSTRMRIPAPTIQGQLSLERALVRFAANLLGAAELPPTVSEDVDCIAFDARGLIIEGWSTGSRAS